jgi:flavin-dependent dehydrogenase
MEHYDVVIIGAGIAGCGLAYNLKKIGYTGSILIIDKNGVGANADYGYRNVLGKVIKKFDLPFAHIYDGIKIGTYDKTYLVADQELYFINYKEVCESLLTRAGKKVKIESAVNIGKNILITNKNKYSFKYLIDSSGHSFFSRILLNKPLPSRYWIGNTRVLNNKAALDNYSYYQFCNTEYFEDLYLLHGKTLHGDWCYAKKIDFSSIKIPKKTLCDKFISHKNIEEEFRSVIPCAPVPPLIEENIVCLGDSFGNGYTASAVGIQPILESSLILSNAIKRGNLPMFQIQWEKKYLKSYLKFLVSKYDTYHNSKILKAIKNYPTRTRFFKLIKNYPEVFLNILNGESMFEIDPNIKKIFPAHQKIFQLFYWLLLNFKYKAERFSIHRRM